MNRDYTKFRFEAVVDWIELVVYPVRRTNWQTVQDAIFQATGKTVDVRLIDRGHTLNPYAHDERDEWVKNSPAFKFRLQDTARFIDVERVITEIKRQLKCDVTTAVTGIEVALDIYGAGAEAMAAMYRGLKNPVSDNQRVYRREKKRGDFVKAAAKQTTTALVNYLQSGWMIGIGNETDDLYQRIYFKMTDQNGGVNKIQVEPRARIEIRLQGKELPFSTLEQLRQYKFTKLSKYFLFRREASPANARGADEKLNRCAGDAIQRLSRTWPTIRKYTKQVKNVGSDFRHNCEGEQPEGGNAKTTTTPDSERIEQALNASALGAHKSAFLITCISRLDCNANSNEADRHEHERQRVRVEQDQQQEASKAGIDSLDSSPLRGFRQSSLCTDLHLEETISINSRCEFLQSCLDTALKKSIKTIADEQHAELDRVLKCIDRVKRRKKPPLPTIGTKLE